MLSSEFFGKKPARDSWHTGARGFARYPRDLVNQLSNMSMTRTRLKNVSKESINMAMSKYTLSTANSRLQPASALQFSDGKSLFSRETNSKSIS